MIDILGLWKKRIKIVGQHLKIIYPLNEERDQIIIEGKIKTRKLPDQIESVEVKNPNIIITLLGSDFSYNEVPKIVKELLEI